LKIDASFIGPTAGDPASLLLKMHANIQRAAREKWLRANAHQSPILLLAAWITLA
jgi:hypothetical protein